MAGTGLDVTATRRAIVIDVRMHRHAGIGTYIRNVVPRVMALRPAWEFTLLTPRGAAPDWISDNRATLVPCESDIYTVREQIELPLRTPRGVDLFWSPHYNIPVLSRAPLAVTVHDVCHLALPELYGGVVRQQYARRMFAAVRRRADEILFVSEFTQNEFESYVGAPRRHTIVHNGVDAGWRVPIGGPSPRPRPYLLCVGNTKPHKNLGALLQAFESLLGTIEHDLVVVGNQSKQRTIDDDALRNAARLGGRVHLVRDADDAALKRYVMHATAVVLPSLYEGFGLPALEAMAAGTPCIVSAIGSFAEVCGPTAMYFNPRDPKDIATQILCLLDDKALSAALATRGRTRSETFTWERTAERTVEALDRAASR
jgi:glycosyltransferase involved in cell wall biosynthesis